MHEKLLKAVAESGGMSDFCKLVWSYKFIQPSEIVEMFENHEWNLDDLESDLKHCKKIEKSRAKVTSHSMVLFAHSDVSPLFMASEFWGRVHFKRPIKMEIPITLEADSPEELTLGLDNPRILQKIKDAGDYGRVCSEIAIAYEDTVKAIVPNGDASMQEMESVITMLDAKFQVIANNAMERASAVAIKEFGKKSNIKSEGRWRAFKCVASVGKTVMSIAGTIGAFLSAVPMGFVALHGCLKNIYECTVSLRAAFAGFEQNMKSAEKEYTLLSKFFDEKKAEYNTNALGAMRVADSIIGPILNPAKTIGIHLDLATKDLNKIDDSVNDLVSYLNNFLKISQDLNLKIHALKSLLGSKDEQLVKNTVLVTEMTAELINSNEQLLGFETSINAMLVDSSDHSAFVNSCQERIDKVSKIVDAIKTSRPENFFILMDALDVTTAIVGGAFAGGSGFVSGINPINPDAYVTACNIVGQIEAGTDIIRKTVEVRSEALENCLSF